MLDESAENIRMLLDSAGALVPPDGGLARIRACRARMPGFDADAWQTICEMGWLALRVPEAEDGLGLGLPEAAALATALGRGLVPEPLNAATLALRLTGGAPTERLVVAAWQGAGLDPRAGVTFDGRLTGRKIAVEGAAGADAFAVTMSQGVAIVDRNAAGLRVDLDPTHDGGFLGTLHFAGVQADPRPCSQMDAALDEAILLHAAYLLGLSERAFEITLDYLRIRKQFGVAIGSFQALQHRATKIKIQLELARASVGAANTPARISAARVRCGSLARLIAREVVQMHGAIGITDEADIGLFVRKAMVVAGLYGTEVEHRRRYMTLREEAAA